MTQFRLCYSGAAADDDVAWVSVYVVLGIAHRIRGMSLAATAQDKIQADFYLQISLKPIHELLLQGSSLKLVQVLLGVAILFHTSTHSQLSPLFVSTAIRMAQDLRLNEGNVGTYFDPELAAQRERIFWIAFFMDMDFVSVTGRLPCHRLYDIDIMLPQRAVENSPELPDAVERQWTVDIFSLRAELALLQAEAYERILSVGARKSSAQHLSATFDGMLARFERYRDHHLLRSEPCDLRKAFYQADMIHILVLEASYFQMLYRLYALSVLQWNFSVDVFSPDIVAKVAPSMSDSCHDCAARVLALFSTVPQGDTAVSR